MALVLLLLLSGPSMAAVITGPLAPHRVPSPIKLPADPPASGYSMVNAFPGLTFGEPLVLAHPPGETNRLFIGEKGGRIFVITNLAAPTSTVFLDLSDRIFRAVESGLLGLAFHPGFATNGWVFVTYTFRTNDAAPPFWRLSRFHVSPDDPHRAIPESEAPLITQEDEDPAHEGGDLHFGPDGYLYVSVGDEGGPYNQFQNSQRIDKDFWAGILRLDVDLREGSLPPNPHPAIGGHYAIPPDNPYIGITSYNGLPVDPAKVRTEFYASGMRNPWRFSIDPLTGVILANDVGQRHWEEVNYVRPGANYGWPFFEGRHMFPNLAPPNVDELEFFAPVARYGYDDPGGGSGNSATAALFYRGSVYPDLDGAYLLSDFYSGRIGRIRFPTENASTLPHNHEVDLEIEWFANRVGIASFGIDPRNGEILGACLSDGTIQRLVVTDSGTTEIPERLSETGAFTDLSRLTPAPGVIPYEINVPFWSDHALKRRWFSLPSPDAAIGFDRDGPWSFPRGTVWIKHFDMETVRGDPTSARKLETRFIVKTQHGAYGVTYRWNAEQTDAFLVDAEGATETIPITTPDGTQDQTWMYPSRSDCMVCHTPRSGFALGFYTSQLNRNYDYEAGPSNQVQALASAGCFTSGIPPVAALPVLVAADHPEASVEARVRSYLQSNCAGCHRPGAGIRAAFDARAAVSLDQTGLIDALPISPFGPDDRLIRPGSAEQSVLFRRVATLDGFHMPPLATTVVNDNAVSLLREWIENDLPARETFAQWQARYFPDPGSPEAGADADPDGDGNSNRLEFLTRSNPRDAADSWSVSIVRDSGNVVLSYVAPFNRQVNLEYSGSLQGPWLPVRSPENVPYPRANDRPVTVSEPLVDGARFYRVILSEP